MKISQSLRAFFVFSSFMVACCVISNFSQVFFGRAGSSIAHASQAVAPETVELEESLFVQDPHLKSGKKGVLVVWIPQPLQKACMGKTTEQCSAMDYCIRTTSKNVSTCKNLKVSLDKLPAYPADMRPRRLMSVTLFAMTNSNKFQNLLDFVANAPAGSLDRLSSKARFKARVKLTRTADDDQFDLLEVLSIPQS
jgi:hypothetical protein